MESREWRVFESLFDQSGDEDLLDLAAVQTLANRGEVFVVSQEEMPAQALAAAILRY